MKRMLFLELLLLMLIFVYVYEFLGIWKYIVNNFNFMIVVRRGDM